MLRDRRLWGPDADVFRPERFLGEEARGLPDITTIPFGFGKRHVFMTDFVFLQIDGHQSVEFVQDAILLTV